VMRALIVVFFLIFPAAAKAQSLDADGWAWLELDEYTTQYEALSRANDLKLEFPQIAVLSKGTNYALVLGMLKNADADLVASELTGQNRVSKIKVMDGEFYSQIIYGVDPFDRNSFTSAGFPPSQISPNGKYYIQIATRFALSQALEMADEIKSNGYDAAVFLAKNNQYAISLEPSEANAQLIHRLKSSAKIPYDSLLTRGQGYREIIWRTSDSIDQRLKAYFPMLMFANAEEALQAGKGAIALKLLEKDYQKSKSTNFKLAAKINLDGLGNANRNINDGIYWLKLCSNTDSECALQLAEIFENGTLIQRDETLSLEYYQKVFKEPRQAYEVQKGNLALKLFEIEFKRGNEKDIHLAANIALKGLAGAQRDIKRGLEWLTRCSDEGDLDCTVDLADIYISGEFLHESLTLAAELYKKAADQGHTKAQIILGGMYNIGKGVTQNFKESIKYFELAAIAGDPEGQYWSGLAVMSSNSPNPNRAKAYFWLSIAVAKLNSGKTHDDAVKVRDELLKTLTTDMKSIIQDAALKWKTGQEPPNFSDFNMEEKNIDQDKVAGKGSGKIFSGSAVYVSYSGQVVTNAHVVDACKEITVSVPGELASIAILLAKDKKNDLALLKTTRMPTHVPALRPSLKLGEAVGIFGYPFAGILAMSGNFTTGNVTALAGLGDDSRHFQISAPVQPGNSGGPMLDQSGNLGGIVVAKANALAFAAIEKDIPQNVNFAIKASVLIEFLDSNSVNYVTNKSTLILEPSELAAVAKDASLFVLCEQ